MVVMISVCARSSSKMTFVLQELYEGIDSNFVACVTCKVCSFKVHGARDRVNYNRGTKKLVTKERNKLRSSELIFACACAIKIKLG